MNEKFCILIKFSRKFVPKGLIENKSVLAPNRRQAITWTKAGPVHWCIYGALGGDELNKMEISFL